MSIVIKESISGIPEAYKPFKIVCRCVCVCAFVHFLMRDHQILELVTSHQISNELWQFPHLGYQNMISKMEK